jgi:hypothetical protein
VQVVNLLVTPTQAEILNLATDQRIQLVLRNPADNVITETTGAATANLFEGGAIHMSRPNVSTGPDVAPKPRRKPEVPILTMTVPVVQPAGSPPPPKTSVVEVLSGNARSQVTINRAANGLVETAQ